MKDDEGYWFPAKPYGVGWGWGLPIRWQGWVVFVTYFVSILVACICLAPINGQAFFLFIAIDSAVFIVIGKWKGEPQHSRPS